MGEAKSTRYLLGNEVSVSNVSWGDREESTHGGAVLVNSAAAVFIIPMGALEKQLAARATVRTGSHESITQLQVAC